MNDVPNLDKVTEIYQKLNKRHTSLKNPAGRFETFFVSNCAQNMLDGSGTQKNPPPKA